MMWDSDFRRLCKSVRISLDELTVGEQRGVEFGSESVSRIRSSTLPLNHAARLGIASAFN